MRHDVILPPPQQYFDVDPAVIDELGHIVDGALTLNVAHMSCGKQEMVFSIARELIDSCSETMHKKTTQIHVMHGVVSPDKPHLVPRWHTDDIGGDQRVVVTNCLPTEFAVGSFSPDSALGKAYYARSKSPQSFENFNTEIDKAVSARKLSVRRGKAFVATYFTHAHMHKSAVNTTEEHMDRVFFKAIA